MTFNRPAPRPAKQMDNYTPRPKEVVLRRDPPATMCVPLPKGVKAKPGKHAPTKAEAEWMSAITEQGCIACHLDGHRPTPGAVHHLLRGGLRMGHLFTISLCDPGHHQNGAVKGVVSRHPDKALFERKYGNEADLLELTKRRLEQTA